MVLCFLGEWLCFDGGDLVQNGQVVSHSSETKWCPQLFVPFEMYGMSMRGIRTGLVIYIDLALCEVVVAGVGKMRFC